MALLTRPIVQAYSPAIVLLPLTGCALLSWVGRGNPLRGMFDCVDKTSCIQRPAPSWKRVCTLSLSRHYLIFL